MTEAMSLLEFFRHCRKPGYYKSFVNRLKVEQVLSLGGLRVPDNSSGFAYGQAYIQKKRGYYSFVGLWTLQSKPCRQPIWVQGTFCLKKGKIYFEDGVSEHYLRLFYTVCRYLNVHKRRVECCYRQAYRERRLAWHEYYDTHDDALSELPKDEQFGSWFFAHDFKPLFCGEVVTHHSEINLDVFDRVITEPAFAWLQAQELKENVDGGNITQSYSK